MLRSVISSLVEEWVSRGDPLGSSSDSSEVNSKRDASSSQSNDEQENGQQHVTLPLMEVVIASPKRGTTRLTQSDIARLMRSM